MGKAFSELLDTGKIGESLIANWLKSKGWNVLPIYEKEIHEGKGPQLFICDGKELVAPDLFVFKNYSKEALWIEAKHKSVFSWHRITGKWTTGIDVRHYNDYVKICQLSPWPVWLLFLHRLDRINSRDEPWPCPVGLFGQRLDILQTIENHRSSNWGKSGMVYWAHNSLKKLASLDEVILGNRIAPKPTYYQSGL